MGKMGRRLGDARFKTTSGASRGWGLNICYLGIRRVSDLCRWEKTEHLGSYCIKTHLSKKKTHLSWASQYRVRGVKAPPEMEEQGRALQTEDDKCREARRVGERRAEL